MHSSFVQHSVSPFSTYFPVFHRNCVCSGCLSCLASFHLLSILKLFMLSCTNINWTRYSKFCSNGYRWRMYFDQNDGSTYLYAAAQWTRVTSSVGVCVCSRVSGRWNVNIGHKCNSSWSSNRFQYVYHKLHLPDADLISFICVCVCVCVCSTCLEYVMNSNASENWVCVQRILLWLGAMFEWLTMSQMEWGECEWVH